MPKRRPRALKLKETPGEHARKGGSAHSGPGAEVERLQRELAEARRALATAGSAERAMLAAIVESSDDAIIGKTLEGIITSWNRAAERIYGFPAEEAIGQQIALVIPEHLQDEERINMARLVRGERIEHYETVRKTRDGRLIDVSLTMSPVNDESGRIIGASKVARDITARKAAEAALRESEERLRLATHAGKVGVWDWEIAADRVTWSESLYAIHGLTRESFGGDVEAFSKLVHPDDRDAVSQAIRRSLEEGAAYDAEFRAVRPDGDVRWIYTSARVIRDEAGRSTRMMGGTVDITERKRAEMADRLLAEAGAALAGSLDYGETLQRVAALVVPALGDWCAIDLKQADGAFGLAAVSNTVPGRAEVIRRLRATFRTTIEGGSTLARVVRTGRSEILSRITDEMLRAAAENEDHYQMLRSLDLRSGVVVPLVVRGEAIGGITIISSKDGRRYSEADLTLVEEIAQRAAQAIDNARLFEELRSLSRFNEHILESSRDCWTVLDAGGRLQWISAAGQALFGESVTEGGSQTSWLDLWRAQERAAAEAAMDAARRGGTGRFTGFHQRAGGSPRWWDVIITPIADDEDEPQRLLAVARDITERIRWEEHQRLLLAELSHRVKNTLATVQSIAMQTMRTSRTLEDFTERFQSRLAALSGVHGLLMRRQWRGATVRELVELVLQPFAETFEDGASDAAEPARETHPNAGPATASAAGRDPGRARDSELRIAIDGPAITLRPQKALALHLCMHELVTNAAKHGVLRERGGGLAVSWQMLRSGTPEGGDRPLAQLTWVESTLVPSASDAPSPPQAGFGLGLIRRVASYELGGEATIELRPEGLQCVLTFEYEKDEATTAASN